jgi:glycosyltransferase involved in cell wall biosynthesis
LPIGIDLTPYQQLSSGENFYARYPDLREKRLLLFLSRFHPKKGLDLLLPAFAQVQKEVPDSVLLMAGDGEPTYVTQLKKQAHSLGIADKIVWMGFLEGREKLETMNAADIFVLPSYSENFGIAAVEAMAAGLPVVVSDQVGIHHEVERATAGKITSCCIEDLATSMKELLINSQTRLYMSMHAKQLVKNSFSKDIMADRLIKLYQGMAVNKLTDCVVD